MVSAHWSWTRQGGGGGPGPGGQGINAVCLVAPGGGTRRDDCLSVDRQADLIWLNMDKAAGVQVGSIWLLGANSKQFIHSKDNSFILRISC